MCRSDCFLLEDAIDICGEMGFATEDSLGASNVDVAVAPDEEVSSERVEVGVVTMSDKLGEEGALESVSAPPL